MNPLQDSFTFLIGTIFDVYMLLVLLRFLFQLLSVNFRNPLVEPIVKLTQPPLRFLRRFVPGLFGVDLSALVLLLGLGLIKVYSINLILGMVPSLGAALIGVVADLLNVTIWVLIIALVIQAIMSWFSPGSHSPINALLSDITQPLVMPVRRLLPSMSGLDFSPMVVLIGLNFLQKLLVNPLMHFAKGLM